MRAVVLIVIAFIVHGCANGTAMIDAGYYQAYDDPLTKVEATIDEAGAEGKLALVVLGGNWCHDSKAFAKALGKDDLSAQLDERYETAMISVGFLDSGLDVAAKYDPMGIFLHTPTVMIIDPATRSVINWRDNVQFRDAYKLADDHIAAYFERYAEEGGEMLPAATGNDLYSERLQAIQTGLIAPQVARISAAYTIIGPLLERRDETLDSFWNPVRDLRYEMGDDVVQLIAEVADAEGSDSATFSDLPTYAPFPWEDAQ